MLEKGYKICNAVGKKKLLLKKTSQWQTRVKNILYFKPKLLKIYFLFSDQNRAKPIPFGAAHT